jgi:DNA invertase Pin-like site-specific DNA recombinase
MVVTKNTDRLSCDKGQLFALLHIFAKAGVHIEYTEGAGCDRFLKIVLSAVAELDETMEGEKSCWRYRQRLRSANVGRPNNERRLS